MQISPKNAFGCQFQMNDFECQHLTKIVDFWISEKKIKYIYIYIYIYIYSYRFILFLI